MFVCVRCCIATVVAAAVLVPQRLEAAPIENTSPNSSEPPKLQTSYPEETPAKTPATDTVLKAPFKENEDHDPNLGNKSDDESNIPRISVAVSSTDLSSQHPVPGPPSEDTGHYKESKKSYDGEPKQHDAVDTPTEIKQEVPDTAAGAVSETPKEDMQVLPALSLNPQPAMPEQGSAPGPASEASKAKVLQSSDPPTHPQVDEGKKETVSQISSVVTMIKPVASSPSTTTIVQDAPSAAKTEKTIGSSTEYLTDTKAKEEVPQINVAVAKMIKPAAASSPEESKVELADELPHPSPMEVERGKSTNVKERKKETPAATSETSEAAVQQSIASSQHHLPIEGKKELNSERSIPEASSDQPLTTVITPVHAVHSEGGETPSADSNQDINTTPASGSPVGITKGDDSSKAYTITPNEFAQMTAVAHKLKSKEESKNVAPPVSGSIPDGNISPIKNNEYTKEAGQYSTSNLNNEEKDTPKQDKIQSSNTNEFQAPVDKPSGTNNKEQKKITTDPLVKEKQLKTSSVTDDVSLMTYSELANEIIHDLKAYSNEVNLNWIERKEKVSWLGEAAEVLHTYNGKIADTEKFSHKCTTDDRQKHKERTERLKGIIRKCEGELKRKDWHELQEKTMSKLNEINAIVKDANDKIKQIPKEDQNLNEKKLVIENDAKRKLQEQNTESLKKTFSELKERALRVDEKDYTKCIDSKEVEESGNAIISETRTDIMKIYECV